MEPIAGCPQLVGVNTMDDDLGVLGEKAHRPGRAGASHRRQHQRPQARLEPGAERLTPEKDAAQPAPATILELGPDLDRRAGLHADGADPGAEAGGRGARHIRVGRREIVAGLVERHPPQERPREMNFDRDDRGGRAERPAGDLDVVHVGGGAGEGAIEGETLEVLRLRRGDVDLLDFDQRHSWFAPRRFGRAGLFRGRATTGRRGSPRSHDRL